MDTVAGVLLVAGSIFILLAGVGVVRFTDIYARMHAAAKAPTLAIVLIALGASLAIRTAEAIVTSVLVVILQLLAGPVGAQILGRAVYTQDHPPLDGPDELATAPSATGAE